MLKVFCAGLMLAVAACGVAAAGPFATRVASPGGEAHIVLVRGGCGPGFHRGPYGGCVANRAAVVAPVVVAPAVVAPVRLPPPCPRGYVRDPDPARPICYPRF